MHDASYTVTRCTTRTCEKFVEREYIDYRFHKIKRIANIWSLISLLQTGQIEKIQRGFEEYDFDFKIWNWATRVTSSTCSTFLLLNALFAFLRDRKILKKFWEWVFVNFEDCTRKFHRFTSISFHFMYSLGCLVHEISSVKIKSEFFV